MSKKASKEIHYIVFSENYYPSLEDLIAEIIAKCRMSAIYITPWNTAYMINDIIPNIPVLDYRKPVYVIYPGCDMRGIPSNVYVMIRAFEHPKDSELFRLITCLYESVDDAVNNRNAIRLVVYRAFLRHHVKEEIIANRDSKVPYYPWSLLATALFYCYPYYRTFLKDRPISEWKDYLITYSEEVANTEAFRRIIRELHLALVLDKYLR